MSYELSRPLTTAEKDRLHELSAIEAGLRGKLADAVTTIKAPAHQVYNAAMEAARIQNEIALSAALGQYAAIEAEVRQELYNIEEELRAIVSIQKKA